jgi:hypothetical protein
MRYEPLWLWWEKMMTNEASYKSRIAARLQAAYVKAVVRQPTQQSNVKAKMDPKSPTGISEDKPKDKS